LLNKLPAARKQDIFPFCFVFSFRKLSTQVTKKQCKYSTFLVIYHHETFGVSPLEILLTAAAIGERGRRKRLEGPFTSSSHGRYAQHIVNLCISLYTVGLLCLCYMFRDSADCYRLSVCLSAGNQTGKDSNERTQKEAIHMMNNPVYDALTVWTDMSSCIVNSVCRVRISLRSQTPNTLLVLYVIYRYPQSYRTAGDAASRYTHAHRRRVYN
jgi:hypothetical protein